MYRLFIICLLFLLGACDSSTKQSQLPKISILMPQGVGWDSKDSCIIDYIDAYGDSTRFKGGIKCRGGLSSRYGKHSYSLELEEDFSFCGLPAEDDWVVNASYIDKTFMRHKLSYDLFMKMHSDNLAPQSKFVRVNYNGENHGLYLLMQRVNRTLIGKPKSDTASFLFKEPGLFYDQLEDTNSRLKNYYAQKHPSFKKVNKNRKMDELNRFLFQSTDDEFLEHLEGYFNLQSLIDWHLLLLLSNNDDGVTKNFYVYQNSQEDGLRFIPWDYDHAYGRDGNGERNDLERNVNPQKAIVLKRLMTIGSDKNFYPKKLKARYIELRKSRVYSCEMINKMIDEMYLEIKEYVGLNFERWPIDGEYYWDANSFEKELEILKNYFPKRLGQLDEYFGFEPEAS